MKSLILRFAASGRNEKQWHQNPLI